MVNKIFNKDLLKIQRNRTAKEFYNHRFLSDMSMEIIIERLQELDIQAEKILDLGSRAGNIQYDNLYKHLPKAKIFQTDIAINMLKYNSHPRNYNINIDPESLAFTPNYFDLIISSLYLHNYNDIPATLSHLYQSLRNGGSIFISVFGANSLRELKEATIIAKTLKEKEIYPFISPFIHIKDLAMLCKRAGFIEPVADTIHTEIHYDNLLSLYKDLKYMGESNKLYKGKKFLSTIAAIEDIEQIYRQKFSTDQQEIKATCEIITVIAFK